jgi:hypothetical protein
MRAVLLLAMPTSIAELAIAPAPLSGMVLDYWITSLSATLENARAVLFDLPVAPT